MRFVEEACLVNPSENIKIDIVHVHVTPELSVIVQKLSVVHKNGGNCLDHNPPVVECWFWVKRCSFKPWPREYK